MNRWDLLGLTMSAGELGVGSPGSYSGTNTQESMYGSNGLGTGNDFGGGGDGFFDTALDKVKEVVGSLLPGIKIKLSGLSKTCDILKDSDSKEN